MPSFWQWLCVSRQRYSTHEPAKASNRRAGLAGTAQSDVMFEVQPDVSLRRQAEQDRKHRPSSFLSSHNEEQSNVLPTDKDNGLAKRQNSREKRKFGARYSALNDSFDSKSAANYRPIQANRPHAFGSPTNELLRRSNSADIPVTNDTDNARKRRHVQDIFADSSPRQSNQRSSQSLYTSDTSLMSTTSQKNGRRGRNSAQLNEEPRKTDSMYGYTPRSVNDDAISAALFGSRIDDYNPDPSWNMAIDKFASSPTSGLATNVSRQGRPRSELVTCSDRQTPHSDFGDDTATYSPDTGRSRSRDTSDTGPVTLITSSKGMSFFSGEFQKPEDDFCTGLDITSLNMRGGDAHDTEASGTGRNSDLDLEKVFSCNGDVLY